jgi:hypothetical protein
MRLRLGPSTVIMERVGVDHDTTVFFDRLLQLRPLFSRRIWGSARGNGDRRQMLRCHQPREGRRVGPPVGFVDP